MKNNYLSSKNYKTGLVILFLLFCGLFSNVAAAQSASAANDTFIWNGSKSSDWADTANWTILRGTTTPGTNTYPGEIGVIDLVYINKSDTPFPAIYDGQVLDIARLYIANTFGSEAGAIFTINPGAILNVGNVATQSNNVFLNGGSIVNNGTLNIKAIGAGFTSFPAIGINCGNPNVLPTIPREYTYSGSGMLTIDLPSANFAGAAAIAVLGNSGSTTTPTNNANVTYKFILNNPEITFNQATLLGIGAVRAAGGNNANKLIIGGTGFTIGTVGSPSIGGLINLGGGTSVTVEAGTTLTLNSAATNLNSAIGGFSSNSNATNFTNKGTIIIQGASARSGMGFSTGASATASVYNINNEGTININLNAVTAGHSGLNIGNGGGGTANAGSVVNVTNTGTMTLKNTSTTVGTGFAIFTVTAGEAPRLVLSNSGTLNLEGSTYNLGLKTTLNNTGILNTNSEFRSFTAVNNNLGGSINFVRTAATATTRQVTFTVTNLDTSGSVGSIYRDSNNNDYAVVAQKFGGASDGTNLVTNVLSTATVPATGTLTRITGTGTTPLPYTAAGLPALNNAAGNVNNSGTINTDTASNLNILSLLSTTATSVLSPGGNTGKGILTLPAFPAANANLLSLQGTLKIQASGSATAGVDYDAMQVTGLLDVINVNGATLDVTGLYTPAVFTTIDIITTNTTAGSEGSVVGPFANVIGLPAKWAVVINPGLGNKAQLVYDPSLGNAQFADFKFSVYPNPTSGQLNLSAAQNISKVALFNILGQKVLSETIEANQRQLNISNLQKGLYVMEVTIDDATQTFKIVKQ
ncbi:T9SS type A sorting domain-containing protein [Flavobacterium nackdongense]|uniref:T9SS type A sorting domain-containing protein n=1 Tax=Flavobacterium nackdongense TaxID=2547394 RepID=A0A4P6YB83_9FLAO|nr:T9SS type A sorting domain-containing protein [Flavobacterium nackdongense]QBN20376.1 T9SS type A sorting domain-containing protein [Flavobacterium nackdongense]